MRLGVNETSPKRDDVRMVGKILKDTSMRLDTFPAEFLDAASVSIDDLRYCSTDPAVHRISYAPLVDGMAILFSTQHGTERARRGSNIRFFHRFVFPRDGGEVTYHRDHFEKECRDLGREAFTGALFLGGAEELAAGDDTISDLVYAASLTRLNAQDDWAALRYKGPSTAVLLEIGMNE
jgi:hypothetical protein